MRSLVNWTSYGSWSLPPRRNFAMQNHESSARAPRFIQPLEVLQQPGALLRHRTVLAVTGWSNATLYRRIAAGEFPAPLKIGGHMARWRSDDVRAYLASLIPSASRAVRSAA